MMTQSTSGLFAFEPTSAEWVDREQWDEVVASLRGQHPRITAFESKAVYVFGIMRHLLEAAGWALDHPEYCRDGIDRSPQPFYFPAYEMACGAVELLGRCVMGEGDPNKFQMALRRGLERMIGVCPCCQRSSPRGDYSDASWQDDEKHIVVSSDSIAYTIGDCKRFRNFMAHGTADPKGKLLVGPGFVSEFIFHACGTMDRYSGELREDLPNGFDLRTRLAKAQLSPLWSGSRPLFVGDLYGPLQSGAMPGGALLHEKHWRQRRGTL